MSEIRQITTLPPPEPTADDIVDAALGQPSYVDTSSTDRMIDESFGRPW